MTALEAAKNLSTELVDLGQPSIRPEHIVDVLREVQQSPEVLALMDVLRHETTFENELSLLGISKEHQARSFEYEYARCGYAGTVMENVMKGLGFDFNVDDEGPLRRQIVLAFHVFESYTNLHSDEVMDMFPHRK